MKGIADIKKVADLIGLNLESTGKSFQCSCLFHDDTKPLV
ncbi:hypothetical protein PULV_a4266 [Pseudoalteromonas ulvae UL12]|nr:hypothetical protein [Pseudoalteromonas ulvae UL12]